jgi:hypothetical protein
VHLAAKAAGLVAQWVPDSENSALKHPVGFDPQEAFTKHDETHNVQNRIGI